MKPVCGNVKIYKSERKGKPNQSWRKHFDYSSTFSITLINFHERKMIKDSQKCQMCPNQSPGKFSSFIRSRWKEMDQSKLPKTASPRTPIQETFSYIYTYFKYTKYTKTHRQEMLFKTILDISQSLSSFGGTFWRKKT